MRTSWFPMPTRFPPVWISSGWKTFLVPTWMDFGSTISRPRRSMSTLPATKTVEDFGLDDHEIFINSSYDYEKDYEKFHEAGNPGEIALTFYNSVWPDISPPGTSISVLTALLYGKPWMEIPPDEYVDRKNAVADFMIDRAETVVPGLRDSIEVVEVSTPITNMRYANTLGGAIYGFNNTPYNHTILRLNPQGPKKGLFFVGAWCKPGGGYSPAMLSGQIAGRMIAMKSKPRTH